MLGVSLVPIIVKKELAELEWLSILLGISIMIFMLLSLNLLFFDHRYFSPPSVNLFLCQPGCDSISALCTVMVAFRTSKRVSSLWALKSKNHHELQQISYDIAHFHMLYLPFRLIHFHSDFWRLSGVFSFNKHRQYQKSRRQAILGIYSHPYLFRDRFNLPDSFHLFRRQGICMYHFWWA